MTENDLVTRYRHLRRIAGEIQHDALALVPHSALLEFGRRLGAVRSGELCVDEPEVKMVHDLAIHTARPGRSRAIDRYARTAVFPSGSDEARVLKALQNARFTTFQIESRHAVAGAMAYDTPREKSFHLMDVSIGLSAQPKTSLIGRLAEVDGFRMSCLTLVPMYSKLLAQAMPRLRATMARSVSEAFQEPQCAIAMYRAAIELGTMRRVVTFDVVEQVPTAQSVAEVTKIIGRRLEDLPALMAAE